MRPPCCLILALATACTTGVVPCSDPQTWSLTGLGMELDNLTRVAVVGHATTVLDGADYTVAVVTYDGFNEDAGRWLTVSAEFALSPDEYDGPGEFVITSDDVRYWPGSDDYSEVCASVYALASNISEPYDLGCIGG